MKKTFFYWLTFELFLAFQWVQCFLCQCFCVNAFGIGSAWDDVALAVVTVADAAVRVEVKVTACTRPGAAHHANGSARGIGYGTSPVLSMATATQCMRWQAIRQPAPGAGPHGNRHPRMMPSSPSA